MALHNAGGFTMHGGTFNNVQGTQYNTYHDNIPQILQKLADQAAMNACHDAEARYPQPNCHPNTRVRTLSSLDQWIRGEEKQVRVCWVYGAAGVGKSAIAQRVSEDHLDQLCGAFFFSRNDASRDKLSPFVATLAYQCCTSESLREVVGPLIIEAIRAHPNVFQTSAENQFQKLLLEPFSQLTQAQRQGLPNLIVVDGLDECVDLPSQGRLLGIIDRAISFTASNPFSFIFLVCSRPEPSIRHGMNSAVFASCLARVEISRTTIQFTGKLTESDLDIQRYLLEKFAELREKHYSVLRHEGEVWPSEEQVMDLVKRASGQFIFAVTVVNYLDTCDERPQDRLETILSTEPGDLPESPYPALDMLYQSIVSTCRHWEKVYPILRFLVTPHPPKTLYVELDNEIDLNLPSNITRLFQLKPGEIETLLSKLHSVIHVAENANFTIHIRHASFTEFLLNKARSGHYHVQQYSDSEYYDLVATLLLNILSSHASYYPPYCLPGQSFDAAFARWEDQASANDASLDYASVYWANYCSQVDTPSTGLITELERFEPVVVEALLLTMGWPGTLTLFMFKECLKWAKSLSDKAPQRFIERTASFLDGFYVGYARDSLRICATEATFDLECGLSAFSTQMEADNMLGLIRDYYLQWWGKQWWGHQFILPITCDPYDVLPDTWAVVHITPTNGKSEMLKRVFHTHESLSEDASEVFDNDVLYGTSESVSQGLVQEEDLAAFKKLLYERRDLFANFTVSPYSDFRSWLSEFLGGAASDEDGVSNESMISLGNNSVDPASPNNHHAPTSSSSNGSIISVSNTEDTNSPGSRNSPRSSIQVDATAPGSTSSTISDSDRVIPPEDGTTSHNDSLHDLAAFPCDDSVTSVGEGSAISQSGSTVALIGAPAPTQAERKSMFRKIRWMFFCAGCLV
ncbi:hypothetical protein VNI00_007829 [Paramarasmius palmivorus]|uniref:Nephrocystin 3-like N-terminal domain-containing protein n=1 Tax=Paramarasmius palmivorus TaxID=297713 RepID=A0AAW0CVB6_9AGAR